MRACADNFNLNLGNLSHYFMFYFIQFYIFLGELAFDDCNLADKI